MNRSEPMVGLLQASATVRGGAWINGVPTHVLAELLDALNDDGWELHRPCPGCCNCAPANYEDPMCDGSGER